MAELKVQNSTQKLSIRESGIEALRIIAMIFVIAIHTAPVFLGSGTETMSLVLAIIRVIAWPAIFCYSFITGYYLIIKSRNDKIYKFLWLSLELIIWRILISTIVLLIITLVNKNSISAFGSNWTYNILLALFDYRLWYFWGIVFIYLLFPFIADYIERNQDSGNRLYSLLLIFLLIIIIMATISDAFNIGFSLYTDHYTLIVVFTSAIIGGKWKLYEINKRINYSYKTQLIGLGILISCYLISFSWLWWGNDGAISYLSIFWYISGFGYFLIFKSFKKNYQFINRWANLSWAIYILHNGEYLPRGLSRRIVSSFNLDAYTSTFLIILTCYLLSIILVFGVKGVNYYLKPYLQKIFKNLSHFKLSY